MDRDDGDEEISITIDQSDVVVDTQVKAASFQ
jgi:hypothetical protein